MSKSLILTLISIFIFLFIVITYILKKGRISEKYALLWYGMDLIILVVVLFHKPLTGLAKHLGFYPLATFITAIFIGILFLLVIALTVMAAGQKKKTTLLIQEISILKNEVKNNDKKKKS